ncbi:hypothetical protein OA85_13685 [Flavobacterium sp. AED]|nr:hypothetical protein OA85_13685 [Flavobacterium sp. AED]
MHLLNKQKYDIIAKKNKVDTKNTDQILTNTLPFIKILFELAFINKKCIFAPLINRGRVPQNLITRLCQ